MSMRGHCQCGNMRVDWQNVDFSLVPRQCGCAYCQPKGAAYVSKSGSRVVLRITKPKLHKIVQHGSEQASFHECASCRQVVMVTAGIEGRQYGALNVQCLEKRGRFPAPLEVNFSDQSAQEKRQRWLQNWCCPVSLIAAEGETEHEL